MKEIWKDIKGFEGLYKVSNFGNIRSLDREEKLFLNNVSKGIRKGKMIKLCLNRCGYLMVNLSKNGKHKLYSVHRIVAKAFLKNYNNYPVVNHIDGNKQNNCINNLEWCTASHNMKEAYKTGLKKPTWKGKFDIEHNKSKRINQYDINKNFIKTWNSMSEAKRKLNIKPGAISNCCRGKSKTAGGFIWKYAE